MRTLLIIFFAFLQSGNVLLAYQSDAQSGDKPVISKIKVSRIDIPDSLITEAYEMAASQNVLAAVNPVVFPGYFSVCADGKGFGYGNTYPSLDGHQMTDALLWLGQVDVVLENWNYVKTFQRPNGQLPLAILPLEAGRMLGPENFQSPVDPNGGLYRHWVPGDPLRALAGPTYIQNADVIFRYTHDREWLLSQLPSVNLTADYLASLVTPEGAVMGAGYYVERPTRVEYDGVAQCHVANAFQRISELNGIAGNSAAAERYLEISNRIRSYFRTQFWMNDHFAEYIHPEMGKIGNHGLTDTDWSSLAFGLADPNQEEILWPQLKSEKRFYYNGMPTGIATMPLTYEKWESTYNDVMDLAAMGRVWYIESMARAHLNDAGGLIETIRRVCLEGRENHYWWRERYNEKGGYGAEKYCEYPANLIRIVQRFLLGVEFGTDGTLYLGPTVPDAFWKAGFGQTIFWRGSAISYKMYSGRINGTWSGARTQQLSIRLPAYSPGKKIKATQNGKNAEFVVKEGWITILLPGGADAQSCYFEVTCL